MVPISQILSKIYWNSNKSSGGTSGCNGAILLKIYNFRWNDIHSFSSLPYDRSKASSKASSPHIWNENQLMSQFYSYIAGSLHVSDTQTHLQESSYSCSHNHWFSICAALFACSVNRAAQILNQWLCKQLYELS